MIDGKAWFAEGVFKNEQKVGAIIPDQIDLPVGEHKVQVDLSFNGQQFSNSNKIIPYLGNAYIYVIRYYNSA